MFTAGIFWGYNNYSFISRAVKTEARVKEVIKGKRRITPVFEYTVQGKNYEYEGASTLPDEYKIGDKETVYYDPALPSSSKTGTFMSLWFVPVFLTGFGIVLFPVGIGLVFFSNKRSPYSINTGK